MEIYNKLQGSALIFEAPDRERSLLDVREASGGLHLKWCSGYLCKITDWHGGLRVLRYTGNDWEDGSIFHDNWASMLLKWVDEESAWLKSIPTDAIDLASKHRSIEFGLLRMAARNSVIYERLLESPLSMALLYDHCKEKGLTTYHLLKYAGCQFVQMYQAMAIPYDQVIAHFINQIELRSFNKSEYSRIKKICRGIKFPGEWADIPQINTQALKAIESFPKLMGSNLLNNIIRSNNGLCPESSVLEILAECYFFVSGKELKSLGEIKSLYELRHFHRKRLKN
jgi:hypothetical protein